MRRVTIAFLFLFLLTACGKKEEPFFNIRVGMDVRSPFVVGFQSIAGTSDLAPRNNIFLITTPKKNSADLENLVLLKEIDALLVASLPALSILADNEDWKVVADFGPTGPISIFAPSKNAVPEESIINLIGKSGRMAFAYWKTKTENEWLNKAGLIEAPDNSVPAQFVNEFFICNEPLSGNSANDAPQLEIRETYPQNLLLLVNREFLKKHRSLVQGFIAAMLEAGTIIRDKRDFYQTNIAGELGTTADWVNGIFQSHPGFTESPNTSPWQADTNPETMESLINMIEIAKQAAILRNDFNLSKAWN